MKGRYQFSACSDLTITVCLFFQSTFELYYILNVVNIFLLLRGKMQMKKVFLENLLKI